MKPSCSTFSCRQLLSFHLPLTIPDLRRYLTSFRGAKFDQLANPQKPAEFTTDDFLAVRKLNVSVLQTARESLLGEAKPTVQRLLRAIPDDLDIWDVQAGDYDTRLGPNSDAWQIWQLVFDKQKGARSSGRGVTAGKLLHAKRPRLIPIYDRARISKALKIDHEHFWEAVWCALQHREVRSQLHHIQASVDEAIDLSLLRVLDIVVWMSQEPSPPTE